MTARDRILLVDDAPANLHALSRALAHEFELSIATSGGVALSLAREQRPDLILLDVMMPEMDGFETLERLRASDWGRDIPVILVTADDRVESQVRGLELGADDFLTKPILLPALTARVRGQLSRKRLREALQASEAGYRQLSEDAPVCVSVFLPDGSLVYVNQRTAALAAQPPEALIGRNFFDWVPSDQRDTLKTALAALSPENPVESHEQTHIVGDSRRVLQWTNTAFFDAEGKAQRYQSVGIDITERSLIQSVLTTLNNELARSRGREFFVGVCRLLAETIDTDMAFIGRLGACCTNVTVVDGWARSGAIQPFTYELAGTPCANVFHSDVACYPHHVQALFPDDLQLVEDGIESYIGATLFDREGRAMGIVVALGHRALRPEITAIAPTVIALLVERIAGEMMRSESEHQTQQQLVFQRCAADMASALTRAADDDEFDHAIDAGLKELGTLLGADRCYLLQLSVDLSSISNTHEWCAAEISAQKDRLQDTSLVSLPFLETALLEQGSLVLSQLDDFPESAGAERAECVAQEIKSLMMVATRGSHGTLTGALGCDSVRRERVWSDTEFTMLQAMAGIVGSALEQRRADKALARQTQYLELIQQLSLAFINLPLDQFESEINEALARIGRFFDVDRAYLFTYDFEQRTCSNTHEWCAPGISQQIDNLQQLSLEILPEWFQRHQNGEAILVDHVSELPEGVLRTFLEAQQIASLIAVPMMSGAHCIGYVGVDVVRQPASRIGQTELELLRLFAELLVSVDQRLHVDKSLRQAASVFEHANEGIMITAPDGTIVDVNQAFVNLTGYAREELLGQNPRILRSPRHEQNFYVEMWQSLSEQGNWTGELWNQRKNGEQYATLLTISAVRDGSGEVRRYVALFSDITAQKAHERQLEHIAHYDALTGLPNRVLLADRMQQAMAQATRRHEQIAVAYLDLDGFKQINDRHGHETGDQLLVMVSERMRQALRREDTIARLGGDEFVAVLSSLQEAKACIPMLHRLLEAAAAPVALEDKVVQVSASLGVSLYPPQDAIDADQLLRQADQAMYQAKVAGKNRYHFFDLEHDRSLRGRHESLERVRQALEQGELALHYQPKVNMRTGSVFGAEALIRWYHPEQGLLTPAAFLPHLAKHALMVALGDWVIENALAQIEQWRAAGLALAVSVNVDPMQLDQPDFVDKLSAALACHPGVQPGDLELEVVETSALDDILHISRIIEACQALGVSFALDDFGTGYSSLTYLKRLPVGMLKIDQSFVRDMLEDPDDLAILQGVIGLANAFRRSVIAEGVESEEHGKSLLQLGCELGQGYAIARPMPARDIPTWIAQWQPHASWLGPGEARLP